MFIFLASKILNRNQCQCRCRPLVATLSPNSTREGVNQSVTKHFLPFLDNVMELFIGFYILEKDCILKNENRVGSVLLSPDAKWVEGGQERPKKSVTYYLFEWPRTQIFQPNYLKNRSQILLPKFVYTRKPLWASKQQI